jgi:cytochrome c peroxidase
VGPHHRAIRRALALLAGLGAAAAAGAQEPAPLSEGEIRAILSHGPWPVPIRTDPSNQVSGKREATEFGERLFFDNRLSAAASSPAAAAMSPSATGPTIARAARPLPRWTAIRLR